MEWVKDKDVTKCMRCSQNFTALRRKHHCRVCGKIFCDNCMKKGNYRNNGQEKICLNCIDALDREQREKKAWEIVTSNGFCTPCGRHIQFPAFSCMKTPEGLWSCQDNPFMIVDLIKNQWVVKDQAAYIEYMKSKEGAKNDVEEKKEEPAAPEETTKENTSEEKQEEPAAPAEVPVSEEAQPVQPTETQPSEVTPSVQEEVLVAPVVVPEVEQTTETSQQVEEPEPPKEVEQPAKPEEPAPTPVESKAAEPEPEPVPAPEPVSVPEKEKSGFTMKAFFQKEKKEPDVEKKVEQDTKTINTKEPYPRENGVYPVVFEKVSKEDMATESEIQSEEETEEYNDNEAPQEVDEKETEEPVNYPSMSALYEGEAKGLLNSEFMLSIIDTETNKEEKPEDTKEEETEEKPEEEEKEQIKYSMRVAAPVAINSVIESIKSVLNKAEKKIEEAKELEEAVSIPEEDHHCQTEKDLSSILDTINHIPMTVDMNLPEIAPENPEKYTSLSETFLINIIVNSNVAVKSFTMKMNKYKQYCEQVQHQLQLVRDQLNTYKSMNSSNVDAYKKCIQDYQQKEEQYKHRIQYLESIIEDYQGEEKIEKQHFETSLDMLTEIENDYKQMEETKNKYVRLYQESIKDIENEKRKNLEHIETVVRVYRDRRRELINQLNDVEKQYKTLHETTLKEKKELMKRIDQLEKELEHETEQFDAYRQDIETDKDYQFIPLQSLPQPTNPEALETMDILKYIQDCLQLYPQQYSEKQISMIQEWFNTILTKKTLAQSFNNTLELSLLPNALSDIILRNWLFILFNKSNNKDFFIETRKRNQVDIKIHVFDKPRVKPDKNKFKSAIIE